LRRLVSFFSNLFRYSLLHSELQLFFSSLIPAAVFSFLGGCFPLSYLFVTLVVAVSQQLFLFFFPFRGQTTFRVRLYERIFGVFFFFFVSFFSLTPRFSFFFFFFLGTATPLPVLVTGRPQNESTPKTFPPPTWSNPPSDRASLGESLPQLAHVIS